MLVNLESYISPWEVLIRAFILLLPVVLLAVCVSVLQARIIHVPADSSTIQGGINGAVDGDTVMIAPGTYYENRIELLGKAITVMSTSPEDPNVVTSTIIDGNYEFNSIIFLNHSNEDTTSIIAGLTIRNGDQSDGGGVYCVGSSPMVKNCWITGNNAEGGYGGGVYCSDSHATFIDCKISNNRAEGDGGGIFVQWNASPTFRNCVISENYSGTDQGGGIYCIGDGRFLGCIISNNFHGGISTSGGMYDRCLISDNPGTGVECYGSQFTYCVIKGNTRGGIRSGDDVALINCTFTENTTGGSGSALHCVGSTLLENCIIWGNAAPGIVDESGELEVYYCDIEGGWPGEGNIDEDPMFVSSNKDDYRLLWSSPCIDTGHPDALDADSTRSDMGAYYFNQNDFLTLYVTPDTSEVAPGGQLGVTYTAINRWDSPEACWLFSQVFLPGGSALNVLGPNQYTLPANYTAQVRLNHPVPNLAPAGVYEYWSRVGMPPGTLYDEDSFKFWIVE